MNKDYKKMLVKRKVIKTREGTYQVQAKYTSLGDIKKNLLKAFRHKIGIRLP